MRKRFFRFLCILFGSVFTIIALVPLLEGNMGWEDVTSYVSQPERDYTLLELIAPLLTKAGITEIPSNLLAILIGPFLLYTGIIGLRMSDGD